MDTRFFTMPLVAPMATIRGKVVGNNVGPQVVPCVSMITGMIGAALGIDRAEHERLNGIQNGLQVAWVIHKRPTIRGDYQTSQLGTPHMAYATLGQERGRLRAVERAGGDKLRTLVGTRAIHYGVDMTAVLAWHLADPSVEDVLDALTHPHWPLSIGARWALPSRSPAGVVLDAADLDDAVSMVATERPAVEIYRPLGVGEVPDGPFVEVETRDFSSHLFKHGHRYSIEVHA